MQARSLKFRLIAVSLAWLAFSLLATGAVLVLLFRAHMQRHFDQTLQSHLEELVAAASIGADGSLDLSWEPADPRFRKPLSGWYWEVRSGQTVKRSRSLLDQDIPPLSGKPGALNIFDNIAGPGDTRLRIAAQDILQPAWSRILSIRVAGPCVTVRSDVFIFIGQLAAALIGAGVGRASPVDSVSQQFHQRAEVNAGRVRRVMIVAMARKLLIALWRYATLGVLPEGAVLKTV